MQQTHTNGLSAFLNVQLIVDGRYLYFFVDFCLIVPLLHLLLLLSLPINNDAILLIISTAALCPLAYS